MWLPDTFFKALVSAAAFGLCGIVLIILGFKLFDWMTPRIDVERELSERSNMAVAIVVAAIILGISYVAGHAISP
ncbi:MAG: DUF350 domain-containing protein [Phycisphaerales bacterium]